MKFKYLHVKWSHAVLFNSPEHLKRFQSYLIKFFYKSFTKENENDNRISFLNLKMIPEQGTFTTSAYTNQLLAEFILNYKIAIANTFLTDVPEFAQIGLGFT